MLYLTCLYYYNNINVMFILILFELQFTRPYEILYTYTRVLSFLKNYTFVINYFYWLSILYTYSTF